MTKLKKAVERVENVVKIQHETKEKKSFWKWITGGVFALIGFIFLIWAKRQLNLRTKELAKYRTQAEQGKVIAKNKEVEASMQRSELVRNKLEEEAREIHSQIEKEEAMVDLAEKELREYTKRMNTIKEWKTLDKINQEGRNHD